MRNGGAPARRPPVACDWRTRPKGFRGGAPARATLRQFESACSRNALAVIRPASLWIGARAFTFPVSE